MDTRHMYDSKEEAAKEQNTMSSAASVLRQVANAPPPDATMHRLSTAVRAAQEASFDPSTHAKHSSGSASISPTSAESGENNNHSTGWQEEPTATFGSLRHVVGDAIHRIAAAALALRAVGRAEEMPVEALELLEAVAANTAVLLRTPLPVMFKTGAADSFALLAAVNDLTEAARHWELHCHEGPLPALGRHLVLPRELFCSYSSCDLAEDDVEGNDVALLPSLLGSATGKPPPHVDGAPDGVGEVAAESASARLARMVASAPFADILARDRPSSALACQQRQRALLRALRFVSCKTNEGNVGSSTNGISNKSTDAGEGALLLLRLLYSLLMWGGDRVGTTHARAALALKISRLFMHGTTCPREMVEATHRRAGKANLFGGDSGGEAFEEGLFCTSSGATHTASAASSDADLGVPLPSPAAPAVRGEAHELLAFAVRYLSSDYSSHARLSAPDVAMLLAGCDAMGVADPFTHSGLADAAAKGQSAFHAGDRRWMMQKTGTVVPRGLRGLSTDSATALSAAAALGANNNNESDSTSNRSAKSVRGAPRRGGGRQSSSVVIIGGGYSDFAAVTRPSDVSAATALLASDAEGGGGGVGEAVFSPITCSGFSHLSVRETFLLTSQVASVGGSLAAAIHAKASGNNYRRHNRNQNPHGNVYENSGRGRHYSNGQPTARRQSGGDKALYDRYLFASLVEGRREEEEAGGSGRDERGFGATAEEGSFSPAASSFVADTKPQGIGDGSGHSVGSRAAGGEGGDHHAMLLVEEARRQVVLECLSAALLLARGGPSAPTVSALPSSTAVVSAPSGSSGPRRRLFLALVTRAQMDLAALTADEAAEFAVGFEELSRPSAAADAEANVMTLLNATGDNNIAAHLSEAHTEDPIGMRNDGRPVFDIGLRAPVRMLLVGLRLRWKKSARE